MIEVAPPVIKVLLALVSILIGVTLGRSMEKRRNEEEKIAWLEYDVPCDGFDDGEKHRGNVVPITANPFCEVCGFRFSSHDAEIRKIHERRYRLTMTTKIASAAPTEVNDTEAETVPLIPAHKMRT